MKKRNSGLWLAILVVALIFVANCKGGDDNSEHTTNYPAPPTPTCLAGDIDADGICDDVDDCIDANHNNICDDDETECVLGDADNDGICDDWDTCLDVDHNKYCDQAGKLVLVCYNDSLEGWAQLSYDDPNDTTGNTWRAVRDTKIGSSGCAEALMPVGYPKPITGVHVDSTEFATYDLEHFDNSWEDGDPTSWYSDRRVPKSVTVDNIFYKNNYTANDYEDGLGYWACTTFDGDCPEILDPPTP